MENAKILFVSQEIFPYLPESEMSLISRNLPQGIQDLGKEIRTFMPKYGYINERRNQLHEVIRLSGMNLIIDDTDHPLIIKVASIQAARMQVYFIDNEDYFQRKYVLTDDQGNEFEDNDERAIFFARGVIETVRKLRWAPDIVHCHGWFTSFLPMILKKAYHDDPLFTNVKIISSIYNDDFKNPLNKSLSDKILMEGIGKEDVELIKTPNYPNIIKNAIKFSDGVIIGSQEIDKDVKEHLNSIEKPVLPYQTEEEYICSYAGFYDKLLMEE
ncbi:MAG: glycogen/starch synthase, partial [Bacteroidota bacterium]